MEWLDEDDMRGRVRERELWPEAKSRRGETRRYAGSRSRPRTENGDCVNGQKQHVDKRRRGQFSCLALGRARGVGGTKVPPYCTQNGDRRAVSGDRQ